MFRQFCQREPIFVIIDVRPGVAGIPTTAYEAVEEVEAEGKEIQRVFKHISCLIEAEEAEEVIINPTAAFLLTKSNFMVCRLEWSIFSVTSTILQPALLRFK